MATIISVHTFRGGTGKSNTTANLAASLAARPAGASASSTRTSSRPASTSCSASPATTWRASLNDFLWHGRDIHDVARDVTDRAARSRHPAAST